MIVLKLSTLNQETFSQFGDLIAPDFASKHYPINTGTTMRFHDIANIDVAAENGRCIVNIFRAQPYSLPLTINMLERHPLSSQAFIPRDLTRPYLIVVAPAGRLDETRITAFLASNGMGVNYAKGVWHHPLLALDKESDFIVIDRGGDGKNCDEQWLEKPLTIKL